MGVVHKLSDDHEADIAERLGARRTKGSGNQWNNPTDGRVSRYGARWGWAFDCKAAMPGTKSIGVTRTMLEKLQDEALSERPLLPLRFYDTERGAFHLDYIAVRTEDFLEVLEKVEELAAEVEQLKKMLVGEIPVVVE